MIEVLVGKVVRNHQTHGAAGRDLPRLIAREAVDPEHGMMIGGSTSGAGLPMVAGLWATRGSDQTTWPGLRRPLLPMMVGGMVAVTVAVMRAEINNMEVTVGESPLRR